MTKIELLERKVRDLYEAKDTGRDDRADWADWMYEHHVFVVTNYAERVAKTHGADVDLSRAGAMLHDVADAVMKRADPRHEEHSLDIARQLMTESGFSKEDVDLIVDDAIRWHSCHDGHAPSSLEGKVLATADSLAHLKTDFYVHAVWAFGQEMTLEKAKAWALKKIPRDLEVKIFFEDVRADAKPDHDLLMDLFSR